MKSFLPCLALLIVLVNGPARCAGWEVNRQVNPSTGQTLTLVSTRDAEGDALSFFMAKETLWVSFQLASVATHSIDPDRAGVFRVNINKPIDVATSVHITDTTGVSYGVAKPRILASYFAHVLHRRDGTRVSPAYPELAQLYAGGTFTVRYYVLGGNYEDRSFDLIGLPGALKDGLAIPAAATEDDRNSFAIWDAAVRQCPASQDDKSQVPCALILKHCQSVYFSEPPKAVSICLKGLK